MQSRQPDKTRTEPTKKDPGKPVKSTKSTKSAGAGKSAQPPTAAFPKKNQPPTAAAFTARLPLSLGKRFETVRSFLLRQEGIQEDVYFYGPKTGWALRYLLGDKPLCSLLLHGDVPVGILSLNASASAVVDWKGLSSTGQLAYKNAHGSPSMLWLDVPLAGTGAGDFKAILRAKMASLTRG